MRVLIRYFFRTLRLILTPVVLIQEKLSTPKGLQRSPEAQKKVARECQKLALYQFNACPFCIRVRKEMARLALPIELREAQNNPDNRKDLEAGGGRIKVPCLRIEHEDGSQEWLYESDSIKSWLQQRFEASPQSA
ncbi:MAG: glutathione S-transferase N-terminal domain-containing protein [Oleiphilaceae bacterium]|nr:glutathione S-transferase N-terminal domain-containing protein [Oleiphilaceae bacterium]